DDLDHVVAGSPVNGDRVRCAVADARAGGALEVDIDHGHVRPAQVVDVNGVGATQGVDVNVLDAVEVHGDVAEVARQARAATVGRDVDFLEVGVAVELERVGARLALDRVAAVARVPDERVVACATGDGVVAGDAVDREIDLAGIERRSIDGVVAGAPADHERVV